jgi:hypothetical protein
MPRLILSIVVGAVVVGGLIALNEFMFRWLFDASYTRWYLANGSLIALVFASFTIAWGDVNKLTGLISAHPYEFLADCLALGAFPIGASGTGLTVSSEEQHEPATQDDAANNSGLSEPERSEASKESEPLYVAWGLGPIDQLLAILFAPTLIALYLGWLLVVAPLQFVVNLLAGAPARVALGSPERAWALFTGRDVRFGASLKSEPLPQGAIESAFTTRPVTYTALIAAALLFIVSTVLS